MKFHLTQDLSKKQKDKDKAVTELEHVVTS